MAETREGYFQWKGYGILRAEKNSLYGGELQGIYIIIQFVKEMWVEGKIIKARLVLNVKT